MKVNTEIDDDTLDEQHPPQAAGDDPPHTMVTVTVRAADGMGHAGAVIVSGPGTPGQLAEALVSALHGAARTHSPDLAAAVERWLTVPPALEVIPGGGD